MPPARMNSQHEDSPSKLPLWPPSSKIPRLKFPRQTDKADLTSKTTIFLETNSRDVSALPQDSSCAASNQIVEHRKGSGTDQETNHKQLSKHPHYANDHFGDPCTLGALDHQLQCGHKIMTLQAESCASNCKASLSPYANPKSIDDRFVCMACAIHRIKQEHDEKLSSFYTELDVVAGVTDKDDASTWIAEKMEIMDAVWRGLETDQMEAHLVEGRFCYALYVHEDYQQAYAALVSKMELLMSRRSG